MNISSYKIKFNFIEIKKDGSFEIKNLSTLFKNIRPSEKFPVLSQITIGFFDFDNQIVLNYLDFQFDKFYIFYFLIIRLIKLQVILVNNFGNKNISYDISGNTKSYIKEGLFFTIYYLILLF